MKFKFSTTIRFLRSFETLHSNVTSVPKQSQLYGVGIAKCKTLTIPTMLCLYCKM